MKKDRSLSVCPKLEEGRHRLPALLGREQTLVGCSAMEAESWLPLSLPPKGKSLSATLYLLRHRGMALYIPHGAGGLSCFM